MKVTPKEKFILTKSKDNEGNEVDWHFRLTLSKPIRDRPMAELLNAFLEEVDNGIDNFTIKGRYTIEITVAATFDGQEVMEAVRSEWDRLTSEIIQPNKDLVLPS
jgi:hypothetical protein